MKSTQNPPTPAEPPPFEKEDSFKIDIIGLEWDFGNAGIKLKIQNTL